MKKIFTLIAVVAVAFSASAANLLTNGGFETWADGKPTGWTLGTATTGPALTATQEGTIVTEGTSSIKAVVDATQNPGIFQAVPVTGGKTYIIKLSYYVGSGDGSDARIWCGFKSDETTFIQATEIQTANGWTAAQFKRLQGGGDNTDYFTGANGAWHEYTVEVMAPANAVFLNFEFRCYKNSTTYWDNCSVEEKVANSVNNPTVSNIKVFVAGNTLNVIGAENGSKVDIYSALGAKVKSTTVENGTVLLDNMSKGIYVVRVGKESVRFVF